MNRLPDRVNLDHLKKQAKDLLHLYRNRDAQRSRGFATRFLPPPRSDDGDRARSPPARRAVVRGARLRLCLVGGFAQLRRGARPRMRIAPRACCAGSGSSIRATSPEQDRAIRACGTNARRSSDLVAGDPYVACAIGDEATLRSHDQRRSGVGRPPGRAAQSAAARCRHALRPLQVPEFRERLHRCARLLLAAGRRSQPAHRQPLASRLVEQARRPPRLVRALWRGRTEPRSRADETSARCRCRSQ